MNQSKIASLRLQNQKLAGSNFNNPAEVVKWMGAVQAQDYKGAKWAIAQRMQKATDAEIEKAINNGSILRTHVLRPTWHFVVPEDIRWMVQLSSQHIKKSAAGLLRLLELNDTLFNRSNDIIAKALIGGKQLTRQEIASLLNQAGIVTNEQRLVHILMRAELDLIICSGGRQGKQFTYALLDDRAPMAKTLTREEALAELALRYFRSRGPATIADFAWWGGLTLGDAKNGLEAVKQHFISEIIEGNTYWMAENAIDITTEQATALFLPAYDEYTVAYKDRSAALAPAHIPHTSHGLKPTIIIDGRVAGIWKPVIKKEVVLIETKPLAPATESYLKAIEEGGNYIEFLKQGMV